MKKENLLGLTLLELIIVIIIVGVLASLALPRYFLMIERARVVEAITNIKIIRQAMERCYLMNNGDYSSCIYSPLSSSQPEYLLTLDDFNLTSTPDAHFSYVAIGVQKSYFIRAQRNTYEAFEGIVHAKAWASDSCFGAETSGQYGGIIMMCSDQWAGTWWFKGFGLYDGMSW